MFLWGQPPSAVRRAQAPLFLRLIHPKQKAQSPKACAPYFSLFSEYQIEGIHHRGHRGALRVLPSMNSLSSWLRLHDCRRRRGIFGATGIRERHEHHDSYEDGQRDYCGNQVVAAGELVELRYGVRVTMELSGQDRSNRDPT